MGIRGRKTRKLTVLEPIKTRRPTPIQGMSKEARTVWLRIVRAYEPDHFKPQHYDLLRSYCENCALNKKAVKEMQKNGHTIMNPKTGITKVSPWVDIFEKTAGKISSLSTKLKLNSFSKSQGGIAAKPKSKRSGLIFND